MCEKRIRDVLYFHQHCMFVCDDRCIERGLWRRASSQLRVAGQAFTRCIPPDSRSRRCSQQADGQTVHCRGLPQRFHTRFGTRQQVIRRGAAVRLGSLLIHFNSIHSDLIHSSKHTPRAHTYARAHTSYARTTHTPTHTHTRTHASKHTHARTHARKHPHTHTYTRTIHCVFEGDSREVVELV